MSRRAWLLKTALVPDAIGSPECFARTLKTLRDDHRKTQEEWAVAIGCNSSVLSRHENGQQNIPPRPLLLDWAKSWDLSADETDELLISAGLIPLSEYLVQDGTRRTLHLLTQAVQKAVREVEAAQAVPATLRGFNPQSKSLRLAVARGMVDDGRSRNVNAAPLPSGTTNLSRPNGTQVGRSASQRSRYRRTFRFGSEAV